MCLAVPAEILECDEAKNTALVSVSGVRKEISLMLVENVQVGDYVLVHVGFALSVISPDEAAKTLKLFDEADNAVRKAAGEQIN